jgi:hypothetical protein
MGTGTRVAITLGVVVVFGVLWLVDDRLSRRPGYQRKVRLWRERLVERRRAQGLRRPSFVIWAALSSVILIALLWSAR